MGGLPYWLLSSKYNPSSDPIRLRSSDPRFMSHVQDWMKVILTKLEPLLYNNDGPIIMLQIENEYGSYHAHDTMYTKMLYKIIVATLKTNVVLFTTDGSTDIELKYGHINGTLQTVDFGPKSNASSSFALLRKHQPNGPIVNSEYYTGWLDHWGESAHHRTSSQDICSTLETMLLFNASVNFYMFAGGTNFGYWSGSDYPPLSQITTSYDYDSPISENGDTTEKYFKLRELISEYRGQPLIPVPANVTRMKYGRMEVVYIGRFWQYLTILSPTVIYSTNSKSYEDLSVMGGYVLYRTVIPLLPLDHEMLLNLSFEKSPHDVARIYIGQTNFIGTMERDGNRTIPLSVKSGDELNILVESLGRICYGDGLNDSKGITGEIKLKAKILEDVVLTDWEMYPLQLENLHTFEFGSKKLDVKNDNIGPAIFIGKVLITNIGDTFIDFPDGNWTSGYILANGFNLGKYEPLKGPQKTLYMPTKAIMKENSESVQVVAFESMPTSYCATVESTCAIDFVESPNIG